MGTRIPESYMYKCPDQQTALEKSSKLRKNSQIFRPARSKIFKRLSKAMISPNPKLT